MKSKPSKEPINLVELIRHHDAISVISPSASRRMVRKGDIQRVREFLDKLDIKSFAKPQKFSLSLAIEKPDAHNVLHAPDGSA